MIGRSRTAYWASLLFFAVSLWILGAILNAFRMARPLPRWFNNFTNVAHSFPRRLDDWSYFAVEARFTGNQGEGNIHTMRYQFTVQFRINY